MATSLPQTVLAELQTWVEHFTQLFGQNGETGVDIALPYHTPVYAATGGPVLGTGYYGGGGVVSIESDINYGGINGPASIYYQHLSDIVVQPGQAVSAGQLIGYSGGQLGYGDHPSSPQFSTGPHIEVGINAPYGSFWHPLGPNVNPAGFLQSLAGGATNVVNGTGGGPSSSSSGSIPVLSGLGNFAQAMWNYASSGGSITAGGTSSAAVVTAQTAQAAVTAAEWVPALVSKLALFALGAVLLAIGLFVLFGHQAEQAAAPVAKTAVKAAAVM
jgi:hypothetical protein